MKKQILSLGLCAIFAVTTSSAEATSGTEVEGRIPISVNGQETEIFATLYQNTTYVSLRGLMAYLAPEGQVEWLDGQGVVTTEEGRLTARPGDDILYYKEEAVAVPYGVRLDQGYTTLPVRILAGIYGGEVQWNQEAYCVEITVGTDTYPEDEEVVGYSQTDLSWLSRIISAESQGESLEGQIAVGNVVLNRVESDQFPDTIYDVIFDSRWGGQFEPVRNGTIYNEPTDSSIEAARLCLEGVNVVGESLYFLAPELTENHWMMETCTYVTTIGCHWFYQ